MRYRTHPQVTDAAVMALLAGKTVVITGSSRGIGRACAIESAKHGATGLVLHYLGDAMTEEEVLSLKQTIEESYAPAKAVIVPGDIGDPATSSQVGGGGSARWMF